MRCTWMMNVKQDRPGDNSWSGDRGIGGANRVDNCKVCLHFSSMSSEDGEDDEDGEDGEDGGLSIMELSRIVAVVR